MPKSSFAIALGLLGLATALPIPATAKGGFFPTYRPTPCEGDACKADDPKSGTLCQGLLCSVSSAKAMQPPVTAAQVEAQKAAAAAATPPVSALAKEPVAVPAKKKRVKQAKAKAASKKASDTAAGAPKAPSSAPPAETASK